MEERNAIEAVRPIVEDHTSGASELTERSAALLRQVLAHAAAATPEELHAEILRIGALIVRAHPNMAPLWHLLSAVLGAVSDSSTRQEAQHKGSQALDRFLHERRHNARALEEWADRLIPEGARVLTHSYSGSVLALMRAAHARGRTFSVVCTESRPLCEGRRLAEQMHALGLETTLIVDAALGQWAARCSLALVGADCVAPHGVVNKIGTRLVALAARDCGIPLYAIAESGKFFPWTLSVARAHSPTEVWESPPPGLIVWNEYFEVTPLEAFTGILTERGILSPAEVRHHLHALARDEPLWSRLRSSLSGTNCF